MGEMKDLKVFTIEEVNQLIPKLTESIKELQAGQQEILAKEVEVDAVELLYPETEAGEASSQVAREIEAYNELVDRFYSRIDEIHEMGCFLKEIEMGLVDFYALYQGRVVYFCWKLGEPEVSFWHEVGRGFTYRQPIIREDEKESSG